VIANRIIDFFCPAKTFALEVDGDTHDADEIAVRDAELIGMGITVLHICNRDVAENIDGVLASIVARLASLPDRWPHPNPSPEGEGLDKEQS
jgi:very-short-patch-repair endonuclease